jgi:hypothetical protein
MLHKTELVPGDGMDIVEKEQWDASGISRGGFVSRPLIFQ